MMKFTSEPVSDHIIRIKDPSHTAMYLLIGTGKAFLIDTGCGYKGLNSFIRSLTDLPVTVLLSHGHMDHASGIYEFDEVYMNQEDKELFEIHADPSVRKEYLLARCPEVYDPSFFQEKRDMTFHPIKDNEVFDAGSFQIHAISVSGHTQGSMVFVIPKLHTAIFGDAIGPDTLMMERECPPLTTYLSALKHLSHIQSQWNIVLRFHGTCQSDPSILSNMITLAEKVLNREDDHIPISDSRVRMFPGLDPAVDHCYLAQSKEKKNAPEGNLTYREDRVC